MNILEKSREFSLMELYKLINDPHITQLKNHIGEVLEVTGFALREEDEKRILSLELAEGDVVASNSPTVQKSFAAILALYASVGQDPFPMSLLVYTAPSTKNRDRNFVDILLVESK